MELEQQRDFIKTVLDNAVDMVTVFDIGVRLIAFNKKAALLLGVGEHSLGIRLEELFPVGINSKTHLSLLRALNGEYVHIDKHVSVLTNLTFESFFIPLYKEGKVYAAIIMHHDISELVKTADELKERNEQLVKSNQELERFAYVASHDLQEPLRKIRTYASLIKSQLQDVEKTNQRLDTITRSAQRMSNLMADLLKYARLNVQQGENEMVDLNLVLENIKQDFELLIEEKNAVIRYTDLPVVEGSASQLTQLFSNLISNSLKFCKDAPLIELSSVVDKGHPDNHFKIIVKDNGVGFENSYAEEIFEVFKRLHDGTSYTGTGIGLAICKRIVVNHHGSISAYSEPGKGTLFTMHLPVPKKLSKGAAAVDLHQKEASIR